MWAMTSLTSFFATYIELLCASENGTEMDESQVDRRTLSQRQKVYYSIQNIYIAAKQLNHLVLITRNAIDNFR